ncbi:MAG: hypothetical protein EHM85_02910 [Desulfobacteraceae bacterium]|nr:MAG: hypothetical protein EHM85_02910 [Desulfobacteraceae bacterium]
MLFLSLLIYILIWPIYIMFIASSLGIESIFLLIPIPVGLYALSFIMAWLAVYIINAFNPELKPAIRNIIRIPGAKWIAFTTAILGAVSLFAITINHGINYAGFGFFITVIIVSLLNALNIEKNSQMLADEQIAPKLVTLPRFAPQEVEKDMVRIFAWKHDGREYELSLVIRKAVYDDCKSKERVSEKEWASEYIARGICGEIRVLAFKLMQTGKPYGTYEEVSFVLSFVQQALKYERDEREYPRYPVESLVDSIGDCEDFSILGASILKLMGYEVALLLLPDHAALGVAGAEGLKGQFVTHEGLNYYYCEMTGNGWKFGERPKDYKECDIKVSPVPALPAKIVRMDGDSSNARNA